MQGSKRDIDVKNRLFNYVLEGEGGKIWENSLETCILPYVNRWPVQARWMKQGTQSQCSGTTQRDGVGRETGGGFRMGGYVNLWLIHVGVWQKPSQYCKVIILQLKETISFKKRRGRREGREKRCLSKGHRRRRQGCGACGLDCTPCCWGQLTPIRSPACQEGLHMSYQVGIKWKYLDTWLWPFTRSDLNRWVHAGLQMMILRVRASH